jgi:hypothetical protein
MDNDPMMCACYKRGDHRPRRKIKPVCLSVGEMFEVMCSATQRRECMRVLVYDDAVHSGRWRPPGPLRCSDCGSW